MAWMRMMGADSVGYHERTVLSREDDPVGSALAYYASRGETPMAWSGAGTERLGLAGEVDIDEWRAVFGTGGASHPESAERLVHCMRPGMELVVSPHKSVAELGVIGRAEDMHAILDAERDATMGYLDKVVQAQGGRRGCTRQAFRPRAGSTRWPELPGRGPGHHLVTRAGRSWVASQRAVVISVDPGARSLVALTPEGAVLRMGADEIGSDKLAHGYAITAHRSQGSTVEVTYALEDGGGRELAYWP